MFCRKCNTECADDANFCEVCGSNLESHYDLTTQFQTSSTGTKKKINTKIIVISVVAVIAMIVLISVSSNNGLSGRYSYSEYVFIEFTGGNTVAVGEMGTVLNGTYTLDGNKLIIELKVNIFGITDTLIMDYTVSDDKNEIVGREIKYTKKK